MKYWYQQPVEQLSKYVRTVLILEGSSQSTGNRSPLFTNGMPALLCRAKKQNNGTVFQLTLFGHSTPADCWEIDAQTTLIAYFFMPFALPGFFNLSAAKLAKNPVDFFHWDPHKTNALRIQLTYAETTEQKTAVLDNLLTQQLQQHKRECEIIQSATDKIMCSQDLDILHDLLNELNITERTFQRMFKKYVGITPIQFRRICQFEQSFTQLRAGQFENMSDVAYDNGFADQSHFIRSFKEFTQTTPNSYLRFGLKGKHK